MCVFVYGCWIYVLKVNLNIFVVLWKSKGFIDFLSGYWYLFLVIVIGVFECKINVMWKLI